MRNPTVALSLACSLLLSCATSSRQLALSPLGKEHVRERYRVPLAGSAIMLPILDCSVSGKEVQPNVEARQYAAIYFSVDLWKQLGLTGTPEDGRIPESDRLCKELSDNHDSGTNIDDASPNMRELLRDYFVRHPEKQWLVAATRSFETIDPTPRSDAGAAVISGALRETGVIDVNVYVFNPEGDIAFRADLACSSHGSDERHDCGPAFAQSPRRVGELLEGFPHQLLAQAAVIKVPAPDEAHGSSAPPSSIAQAEAEVNAIGDLAPNQDPSLPPPTSGAAPTAAPMTFGVAPHARIARAKRGRRRVVKRGKRGGKRGKKKHGKKRGIRKRRRGR